jgi:hypothetical protein
MFVFPDFNAKFIIIYGQQKEAKKDLQADLTKPAYDPRA